MARRWPGPGGDADAMRFNPENIEQQPGPAMNHNAMYHHWGIMGGDGDHRQLLEALLEQAIARENLNMFAAMLPEDEDELDRDYLPAPANRGFSMNRKILFCYVATLMLCAWVASPGTTSENFLVRMVNVVLGHIVDRIASSPIVFGVITVLAFVLFITK